MPVPKEELIKIINLDEPDYDSIVSKLTSEDIPTLIELSKDPDNSIATKAISCLGLMSSERSLTGLQEVADHPDPIKRVAVANSLKNMSNVEGSVQLLDKLLDDSDVGVKKFSLQTIEYNNIYQLKDKVRTLNQNETNSALKTLSQKVYQKLD